MRRSHGVFAGLLAVILAVAFAYYTTPARVVPRAGEPVSAPSQQAWHAPVWTGGWDNAERHWQKHGGEFPQYATAQDYVNAVHNFLLHPPSGTLIKHRPNGDTLYFDPASGTFAVQAENGAPRTFFKPDDGMRYWNRQ